MFLCQQEKQKKPKNDLRFFFFLLVSLFWSEVSLLSTLPSYFLHFSQVCLFFSSEPMNLCTWRVCPLASVFHFSMQSSIWLPAPTLSCECSGDAPLPSQQLVCFPPYATRREWGLAIFGRLRGEKILHPDVMQFEEHKNVPYFSLPWQWPVLLRGHVWKGFVGRAGGGGTSSRAHGGSGSVPSWFNMVIKGHLFLSGHKASDLWQSDRWISGSELDKKKRGHARQRDALTRRRLALTCAGMFPRDRPDRI